MARPKLYYEVVRTIAYSPTSRFVMMLTGLVGVVYGMINMVSKLTDKMHWGYAALTVCGGTVAFLLLLYLLVCLVQVYVRGHRHEIRMDFEGELHTFLTYDGDSERIAHFHDLRGQASRSMFVMGIGMTFFSRETSQLRPFLKRGVNVRLLMLDPRIVADDRSTVDGKYPVAIQTEHFDGYHDRSGYRLAIIASLRQLHKFIKAWKKNPTGSGRIELRAYPFHIPLNLTAVDEHDSHRGKLLVEFCLPFCDQRLRLEVSRPDEKQDAAYASILGVLDELYERSTVIVNDKRETESYASYAWWSQARNVSTSAEGSVVEDEPA